MPNPAPVFRFGPFRLNVAERRLSRDEEVVPLRLKVFDTLRILVENPGRLLTKEELLEAIWPGTAVEENNLNHNVSILRKALGEHATGQSYIETIPRLGYRFVAPVEVEPAAAGRGRAAVGEMRRGTRQEIRYCTTADGVRLAYATSGSGPALVKASNWLTHLDFERDSPIWRHWWDALSRHHTVVRYDERGNGMSQRDVTGVSFDTWVRDLETIVDAAALDRFALLGISRGASIAIAYAVRHPERVSHLILYGGFAAGLNHTGNAQQLEARSALNHLTRLGWGLNNPAFCKMFTHSFIPESTPEHEAWFDELQRVSTSPENAARLMDADDRIDVRRLLPEVRVPTLVVHCDRDHAVRPERGRELAAAIAGSRYVSLPSANHLPLETEPAWPMLLEELGVFIGWDR
jgi:DNA-binding winged helix-turn-helix (wHTH) protein/pimeloyl-ACP methyl ester carboxylesterase